MQDTMRFDSGPWGSGNQFCLCPWLLPRKKLESVKPRSLSLSCYCSWAGRLVQGFLRLSRSLLHMSSWRALLLGFWISFPLATCLHPNHKLSAAHSVTPSEITTKWPRGRNPLSTETHCSTSQRHCPRFFLRNAPTKTAIQGWQEIIWLT